MDTISIIAAIADNNAIGKNQQLLWHLPADMKHFKELTTGHAVIMGRKTFESLPNGPLPNRKNVPLYDRKYDLYLKAIGSLDSFWDEIRKSGLRKGEE